MKPRAEDQMSMKTCFVKIYYISFFCYSPDKFKEKKINFSF